MNIRKTIINIACNPNLTVEDKKERLNKMLDMQLDHLKELKGSFEYADLSTAFKEHTENLINTAMHSLS